MEDDTTTTITLEDEAPQRTHVIPLSDVLRGQWMELVLFGVRLGIFFVLQVFFEELAIAFSASSAGARIPKEYLLLDSLAASACCWLIIGATWCACGAGRGIWHWCRTPVSRGRFWHSLGTHIYPNSLLEDIGVRGITLRRTTQEDDEELFFESSIHTAHASEQDTFLWLETLPWTLWSCMQSCGLAIFVLGYCIGGMFWLPQHTLVLAILGGLLFVAPDYQLLQDASTGLFLAPKPHQRKSRAYCLGVGGQIVTTLLILGDQLQDTPFHATLSTIGHNLWLGLLVPLGTVWILYLSRNAPVRQADAVLPFGMPSLILLSVTYFSLYLPAQECDWQRMAALDNATASSAETLLMSSELLDLFMNATHAYYDTLASSSIDMLGLNVPRTPLGAMSLLLAPTALWLSVLIVIRSCIRTPSRVGSTMAAYVMALLIRRMHLRIQEGQIVTMSWTLILLLVSIFLTLVPELRCLEIAQRCRAHASALFATPIVTTDEPLAK